jgi:putative glycosyl hydrolase-like family 15 (GHL15) protein/carbohydrate binding protein with CBM4/9 domain
MSPCPTLLRSLTLVALLSLGHAAPAVAAGYPRLGLYGGIMGIGYPYIAGGNRYGPLDEATCDSVARFDQVIIDASPVSEYRPDVAAALRARNPDISLLAYVNAGGIWLAAEPDSTVHYPTRFRRLVRDMNGFLYNRAGGHYSDYNVNLAKRDQFGRYVLAEALADLFHDAIVSTGAWDGMFFDVYCDDIGWTQTPAESIDYQRAGHPTLAAFNAAYQAGGEALATRLRNLAGPSFLLVGNCGQGTKYTTFNGWMRENFPLQNGGTWYENMFRTPGGYFTDDANFLAPRHNYLFSAAVPSWDPYAANNARKVRFGLGSASLGEGYGAFGNADRNVSTCNYSGWWYDEYAVDATGRASDRLADTGWLGQPLGPPFQMIWIGSAPDASTNPDFETDVTTGWTFVHQVPATLTRDATTAASGSASARISVPAVGPYEWSVYLRTVGTIPIAVGRSYSATFWARSSAPRTVPVVLNLSPGGEVARRTVDLTTEWRRHQLVLIPHTAGNGVLSFFLGRTTGDIWLDDVHLQEGVTNLWRRDFQNGAVLVNPGMSALTVDLGRPYQRIAGVVDPLVNDGLPGSLITVGAQDARFLLGDDLSSPAPVVDLRAVPR